MDNAQKAIMIGVGLFITIIIIAAVLLITNMGTGMVKKSESDAGNITAQMKADIMEKYDGKTLTGAEVLGTVKAYYSSQAISICVIYGNNIYGLAGFKNIWAVARDADSPEINAPEEESYIGTTTKIYLIFNPLDVKFKKKTPLKSFSDNSSEFYISNASTYASSVTYSKDNNELNGIVFRKV